MIYIATIELYTKESKDVVKGDSGGYLGRGEMGRGDEMGRLVVIVNIRLLPNF